ncbi:hypothetical protein [Streptomyces beijiangensis]|uniref:Uncharacterized protein n=1 Tax=Streptomyces beijiangensis TaxID=163361 RepID=A0A939JGM0_9ACTN|nr:hypothetical protein [Streptomyces beijiangensis]MBO0511697.1 hypothetical protein [Streptomyces beijiangensis]
MATRYVLRLQVDPADDPESVGDRLLALAHDSRADEICVFLFGMEFNDGHDSPQRIGAWLDATRPWRTRLRTAGVDVSLNPGHTVGHSDWGRTLTPDQPWQPMVDQYGRSAAAQVCPLDPGWRAYFASTLRRYADEDVCAVWIEDDIRLHNHRPLDWGGCFCPLHLDEFARRTGVLAERDELVAACTAPGEPHPWRGLWLDFWDETGRELLTSWREILGDRLGLMSSRTDQHAAEGRDWSAWLDLAALHRPHFWGYSDGHGRDLPYAALQLDMQRREQPDRVISLPEIECWPYGQWNKSFRQTAAQMSLAHVLGCDGLAVSLYDFLGNHPDDEPGRAAFLARWRDTFDWLSELFPKSLRTTGIGLPWSEDTGRLARADGPRWQSLVVPHGSWAGLLGAAGHAVTARGGAAVNALSGEAAWAYPDEELRRWLTGGLLLDGVAARILFERGYGPLIGLEGAAAGRGGFAREVCTDPEFALRPGCRISADTESYDAALMLHATPSPSVRVASTMVDQLGREQGPGLMLYGNDTGGRVAITPWPAHTPGQVLMNPQREAQLGAVLDWLSGSAQARACGHPWLVPQALTDGTVWRLVVWNASPDAVSEFSLRLPAGMPEPGAVVQVTADGERIAARWKDGRVVTERPLGQWEFVVLSSNA